MSEQPESTEKIESVRDLADWLPRAGVKGVVAFAQSETDPQKVHVVIVNGDEDFLAAAGVACMGFMEFVAARLKAQPSDRVSRAERRRAMRDRR